MQNTRHLQLLAHFERLMKDRGWRPPTWPEKRVLSETFFFVVPFASGPCSQLCPVFSVSPLVHAVSDVQSSFASGPCGQLCPVFSRLRSMQSVMSSLLSPLVHAVSYVQFSLASGPCSQLCPVFSRLWSMWSVMSSLLSPLVYGVSYVSSPCGQLFL